MNELITQLGVVEHEGKVVVSSLDVARVFEKEHKNVLQAIENLDCSFDFQGLNFERSIVKLTTPKGGEREQPICYLTRDGFTFLAMGFTGAKAAHFKEEYIKAFNLMEEKRRNSMNDIITVSGINGYIDKMGVAQLNAAHVARGWGFTQRKKE